MKLNSIIQSFALFFLIITTLICGYAVAGVNQISPLAYELGNQQDIVSSPISPQQRQAKHSFVSAMNLALNGDMTAALPMLKSVNLSELNPKEQSAVNVIRRIGGDHWQRDRDVALPRGSVTKVTSLM